MINDGFNILRKRIARLESEARINIERSDGLLVDWLVRNGYAVYLTPPLSLHHRRPRRSKNDKGDAYLLAHLLRVEDPECRLLAQRSDLVEKLCGNCYGPMTIWFKNNAARETA
jgi:transposase